MTVSPLRNDLQVFIRSTTQEGLRAFHEFARRERDRVLQSQRARSGIAPDYLTIADGRRDAPIESARNVVIFQYFYWKEIVEEAMRFFQRRAPRLTGAYLQSVKVFVDGSETVFSQIPRRFSEITIASTVPYSRRLEVGTGSDGRPFVKQVPPRIVEAVTQHLKKRFGRIASFRTEFRALEEPSRRNRGSRRTRRTRRDELTFPTVVIRPL